MNRYIARAGVCSRRKADGLIDRGLVKVNGTVAKEYWTHVRAEDVVEVNGHVISPRRFEYVLMNKPTDTITTTKDYRGRRTVLDLVPFDDRAGLFPVGRLDRHTTGVLILTSDGDLAHRLMHPRWGVAKRYVVRTRAEVPPEAITRLRRGLELDDGLARADMAAYLNPMDRKTIGIEVHEGRNRQIRRMLAVLGCEVESLERVSYGHLTAKGVRRGKWRKLQPWEITKLRRLVHLT